MLALHGNITRGKLNAIESTNPILITSLPNEGDRFIKILPASNTLYIICMGYHKCIEYTRKAVRAESHIAKEADSYVH